MNYLWYNYFGGLMSKFLKDNTFLIKEYDFEKNKSINLDSITEGMGISLWWKCEKGHEWQASVNNRSKGRNCPYCSNRKVLKGYNDLETTNPELSKEWNYEKNGNLKPDMISKGSHKKVWWKCEKGHEWQAIIYNRAIGNGCIYCSNQKVLKGYNDLESTNPELSKEWNYEKNGNLKPDMFTFGSSQKVWWKCEKGNEWEAAICYRNTGIGCPICNEELQTSFPERAIYYYIKKYFDSCINNYRVGDLNNKEIDIFIPELNVGIEYDGEYYHKSVKKDLTKDELCEKNNIKLIRIREVRCPKYASSSIKIYLDKNNDNISLGKAIYKILEIINVKNPQVNVLKDLDNIRNLMHYMKKEQSLISTNPEIIKEWYYEKNKLLDPSMVTAGSEKIVWWKCKKGHEWQARINGRCGKKLGCPYCANKKVLNGYNDLITINPELSKEWNYEKNGELKPNMITSGSNQKVWWKCKKGHEWKQTVWKRTKGYSCPVCSNQKVLVGYNDLMTTNPELLEKWNYKKNGELKPNMITSGSNKKVWWKCEKEHEWEATPSDVKNGRQCPICSNNIVLKGYNDLMTINPELSKEWNYEKNGELKPDMVVFGSTKKVWWRCKNGHEWKKSIVSRTWGKGSGCPYCANKKVLKGYNDLMTINPELSKEWNYEKNGELKPNMVTSGAGKKVWWKCSKCGHEWEALISHRKKGHGCPQCANHTRWDTRKKKSIK